MLRFNLIEFITHNINDAIGNSREGFITHQSKCSGGWGIAYDVR